MEANIHKSVICSQIKLFNLILYSSKHTYKLGTELHKIDHFRFLNLS